jgi:hypothetical protein
MILPTRAVAARMDEGDAQPSLPESRFRPPAHWFCRSSSGRILPGARRQDRAVGGESARAQRVRFPHYQLEGTVRAHQHGGPVEKLTAFSSPMLEVVERLIIVRPGRRQASSFVRSGAASGVIRRGIVDLCGLASLPASKTKGRIAIRHIRKGGRATISPEAASCR